MHTHSYHSPLRLIAVLICLSLLFSNPWFWVVQGQGQRSKREGRPRPGKPEGVFPDLEEVQRERNVERQPAPPIHSTTRSPKNPLNPWNGRRVGDPGTRGELGQAMNRRRRAHASRRAAAPPTVLDEQFIANFFQWTVVDAPNGNEPAYWNDQLRVAYAQGQTSLKLAAVELGKTLFESAKYAERNRNAHDYVYDLYKTYLMREPDTSGWDFWTSQVAPNGRENVRRAFEECSEFAAVIAGIVPNGSASANAASLISARVDPKNQPGNGMLARDATWSVPLLSLPGRAGLDLGLALSYSSMVWTRNGPYLHFDEDNGFPSPGFRLGFPTVQRKVFDAQTGKNSFLMITATGRRIELRQVGSSNVYEAGDSSYLQLIDNTPNLVVRSTDGTQLSFAEINNEYSCTQVRDRNGNYITVHHNGLGRITAITDTLGRVINFNYDNNANLISITQSWNGQPAHQWVAFSWGTRNMQSSFPNVPVIGTRNGTVLPVVTGVTLNDTSQVTFDYNNSLQVNLIRNEFGAIQRSETVFTYETPAVDVPRLIDSRVSARNWTGINGVPSQVSTTYGVDGNGACVMTAPDGTVYKEYYGTGWQRGLTPLSEVWSGGSLKKWTTTSWTQDNTSVGYEMNPRVVETKVHDGANTRRTVIDYGPYAQWGLPYWVKEYAANGTTEIRHTFTDYNLSQVYLDKRIIGLVLQVHLKNATTYESKITYDYDDPARLQSTPAAATQHDLAYSSSLTARGNVTAVSRWDVNDINNASKKLTTYTNYYTTGSPSSTTDPASHQSSIAYADSFSDNLDRNTFAYPTTLTDAGGSSSYIQYNFDFGATTRTQSPAPAQQAQGAIQTMTYNSLGQLERTTTTNNGAYKRFWYGADFTASYATVNNVADEAYSIQTFDGLGRPLGAASNHPGSNAGYKAQINIYDFMGRVQKTSNPAETNSNWVASGDDSAGWLYTEQTHDWQGRPLITTNPDTTTRIASYSGCGCAGTAVVTLTDETGRRQKVYSDVRGREVKVEVMNWDGTTVYSTRTNTHNARDQIISVKQFQGSDSSGIYQEIVKSYDGYGRLVSRKDPVQTTATTYTYNSDSQPATVTDARGVTQTFTYNNRELPINVSYSGSGAPLAPVTIAYDSAGNRTSMSDGSGSTTYQYNQLSQLISETRQFAGRSGSYTISYEYSVSGALSAITDHAGSRVNYTFSNAGNLTAVTGSGAHSFPTYASNFLYRAWGGIRDFDFGNGVHQHLTFNSRLQNTSMSLSNGSINTNWTFDYYDDGKIRKVTDSQNPLFDRAFDYDHIGRLKEVRTGSEARGGTTPDGPFKQTYNYDVWENTTSRNYRIWAQGTHSDGASFTNNRRQSWSYDNEGNLGSDSTALYGYDAAGRQNHFTADVYIGGWPSQSPIQSVMEVLQTFDGNSAPAKKTTINRWEEYINEEPQVQEEETTVYYLRSTALGGKVIAELDSAGAKRVGYVFAGAMRIATHYVWSNSSTSSVVEWTSTSPATGSEYMISGTSMWRKEFDPLGADVTAPPPPSLITEPVFYNPRFDQMALEIEGGPSEEYLQANRDRVAAMAETFQALHDREEAEKLWQAGKRDEALAILQKNPNVGIEYRALAGGEVVRSGSYFGKDAADFLIGLNMAVDAGLLSPQTTTGAYSHHAGASAQNSVTEDNPEMLQGANNGKDCGVVVTFKAGTINQATGFPNGPSTITYHGAPNFGLGFSVSGWVDSGGIGTIGVDRESGKKVQNPANPKGRWSLEQWTHSWIGANGKTLVQTTTFPDLFLNTAGLTVQDNTFGYYDHPGGPPPSPGLARYDNYLIKVYAGKTVCEVGFHLVQNGNSIRWGRGLR